MLQYQYRQIHQVGRCLMPFKDTARPDVMHHILLCIKDFRSGIAINKEGLPAKSGAEFHAERHAEEMSRQGHMVTIFAKKLRRDMANHEMLEGYYLHRLWPALRGISLVLLILLCYRKSTALHIMGRPDFAAWAIPVAQWLGIPVTVETTIVGEALGFPGTHKWWKRPVKALREKLFRRADLFIANSREIADDLVERGMTPQRILLLPQGIDVDRFSPVTPAVKDRLRRQLGLPENSVIILFCCRIIERKGIDLLLAAWPEIRRANPDAYLVLVGGGAPEWLAKIGELIAEDRRVIYVPEVDDPVPYYQASDIYVFPSRREGLPTSLMEAMGCGLAPVVSAIGGNVDLVDEEAGTGIIFPVEDPAKLAESVIRLLEDPVLCRYMGARARRFVEDELDRRELVACLVEQFEQVKEN